MNMEPRLKVLVIEDEPDMAMGLRDNLAFEGYEVLTAADGERGVQMAEKERPSCILLDVMLPGIDGFEACQRMRKRGIRAPIIMLTARGQEIDKVRGLELGADDYMTKPFGLQELLARIRAVLRRAGAGPDHGVPEEIVLSRTHVSLRTGRVARGKKEAALGHYEAEILKMLLRTPGAVVERRGLLREIWGLENEPMNRSVDNHVVSLRRKIEEDPARPRHILTVHGFGYKLVL
jgi:DNA-binding response OmpR family regulator